MVSHQIENDFLKFSTFIVVFYLDNQKPYIALSRFTENLRFPSETLIHLNKSSRNTGGQGETQSSTL